MNAKVNKQFKNVFYCIFLKKTLVVIFERTKLNPLSQQRGKKNRKLIERYQKINLMQQAQIIFLTSEQIVLKFLRLNLLKKFLYCILSFMFQERYNPISIKLYIIAKWYFQSKVKQKTCYFMSTSIAFVIMKCKKEIKKYNETSLNWAKKLL